MWLVYAFLSSFRTFFQNSAAPALERIIDLHNEIMTFLVFIIFFVTWILFRIVYLFNHTNTKTIRFSFQLYTRLEQIWTTIPALVLLLIALPSSSLLYISDELTNPLITLRVTGWQWYWEYNYADLFFDSIQAFMFPETDLKLGQYRLLEVDNKIALPDCVSIRFLITDADVIHSWAIPALGIKTDAIPGRLNQTSTYILRVGTFYGQCSELCGINHGFMPIVLRSTTINDYLKTIYHLSK